MSFKVTTVSGLTYRGQLTGDQRVSDILSHTYEGFNSEREYPTDASGNELALSAVIPDGSQIFLKARQAAAAAPVESSTISVTLVKMGRSEVTFDVPSGTTIADALASASMDPSGCTLYLDNSIVGLDNQLLASPARISLVGKVKGGN